LPERHAPLFLSFDIHLLLPLFRESLESVGQLRATFPVVCELADEQRERLGVSGDPQGASVHRIKARVMDPLGGHTFGALVVADPERQEGR
jgi:hypothetical protein